jgi:type I restriction-modification system DNA methylase subunit
MPKGKELFHTLESYKEWLLSLKILDPACGSGAFLNQALSFLIEEHKNIDDIIAELTNTPLRIFDTDKAILENNIFGVDINDESVEIAKLSLWLRTAQKGRKLSNLNDNIKCGNSLIDDPVVAGDKAFNWEEEFPQIFENGGFDILIGNPPYVGEKGHAEIFDDLKKIPKWKEFYRRRSNIYYFFIKHGIDLLKDNGIQSLIIPREFTNADWANKVRETILENSQIIEIIDFSELKVFSDAGTTSLILTQQKAKKNIDYQFQFIKILIQDNIQNELFNNECRRQIKIDSLKTEDHKPWDFNSFRIEFNNKIKPLSVAFNVSQGIVSGSDKVTKKHVVNGLAAESEIGRGVFILDENIDIKFNKQETLIKINDEWITLTVEDINLIKPYYKPENLQKWTVTRTKQFIVYVGRHNMTENIKRYLLQYDKILLNRSTITEQTIELSDFLNYTIDEIKKLYSSAGSVQKIMRRKQWYLPLYERANVPFDSEKIVVNTKNMDVFTYSDKDLYSSGGGAGGQNFIYLNTESEITKSISEHTETDNFISYVNAILNSKIIKFIIKLGQYNQLSTSKIADLPIRIIDFNDVRDKVIFETINTNTTKLRRINTELNTLVKKFQELLIYYTGYSDNKKLVRFRI